MRRAIRDPRELCRQLRLPPRLAERTGGHRFPLLAPLPYVRRMQPGNPTDPLLRQVWPDIAEDEPATGFVADPVGDTQATRVPGLLHKYHGRALLIATSVCAVHCRYCFRREFPYPDHTADTGRWDGALATIAGDPSISEVILSGGDPLMLSDSRFAELVAGVGAAPHVRRLRIHTRLPIVIPSRVTPSLAATLANANLTTVVVIHTNHVNEIDADVRDAITRLRRTGALLLNQSVLLRGVNDSSAALAQLSEGLIDAGVTPYYLHELDRVRGAAHFQTPNDSARLVGELRDRLPGYAVPRLVREEPGKPAKTVLV